MRFPIRRYEVKNINDEIMGQGWIIFNLSFMSLSIANKSGIYDKCERSTWWDHRVIFDDIHVSWRPRWGFKFFSALLLIPFLPILVPIILIYLVGLLLTKVSEYPLAGIVFIWDRFRTSLLSLIGYRIPKEPREPYIISLFGDDYE